MTRSFARLGVLALALASATACSDAPTAAPSAAPAARGDLLADLGFESAALTRRTPLAQDLTVSAKIGSGGGIIAIPAAGFRLVVPKGALIAPMTISATAVAGSIVAYEFEPHGTKFPTALRFEQDLSSTKAGLLGALTLQGGYFVDRASLDFDGGTAIVSELLPLTLDLLSNRARFEIHHFSGYMISTGRAASSIDD